MHLLEQVIFLQTPDDRSACRSWYAIGTVARVADQELGAEDGLGLSDISERSHHRPLRDMSRRMRGPLSGICRRGQRRENSQNRENSRTMIADHVYAAVVRGSAVPSRDQHDAANALEPI